MRKNQNNKHPRESKSRRCFFFVYLSENEAPLECVVFLTENLNDAVKCEHRIWLVKCKSAKSKPIYKQKEITNQLIAENVISFSVSLMKSWLHHDEIFALLRWNPRSSLGWDQIRLTTTLQSGISSRQRFHPTKVDFIRRRRIWLRDTPLRVSR